MKINSFNNIGINESKIIIVLNFIGLVLKCNDTYSLN